MSRPFLPLDQRRVEAILVRLTIAERQRLEALALERLERGERGVSLGGLAHEGVLVLLASEARAPAQGAQT
jgi:hypothetical protein